MIDAVQSAAGGMAAAQARFTEAAVQVARMRAGPSGTGQATDTGKATGTDLPAAARIELSQAAREIAASRAGFAADADAAADRVADDATRRLLDVRA